MLVGLIWRFTTKVARSPVFFSLTQLAMCPRPRRSPDSKRRTPSSRRRRSPFWSFIQTGVMSGSLTKTIIVPAAVHFFNDLVVHLQRFRITGFPRGVDEERAFVNRMAALEPAFVEKRIARAIKPREKAPDEQDRIMKRNIGAHGGHHRNR